MQMSFLQINSVDLSSSSSREARDEGKEVGKNGKKTDKAKLDVNWNILSTNDAGKTLAVNLAWDCMAVSVFNFSLKYEYIF